MIRFADSLAPSDDRDGPAEMDAYSISMNEC